MRTSFARRNATVIGLAVVLLAAVPALAQQTPPEALTDAIALATVPAVSDGRVLLPTGTRLDRLEWVDNLANIDLTVPADASPEAFTVSAVEDLYKLLADAVDPLRTGGGLAVRARFGVDGDYLPVEAINPPPPLPPEQEVRETPATPAVRNATKSPAALAGTSGETLGSPIGGQVGVAGTQPVGALTGVTVFAAAGHGWTAGSAGWYLQRELLLDMNEDYGNIDQLNYFVQYAYNAGATVVPFRPVGYQNLEFVLDNDDPGVTWTGDWTDNTNSPEYYENGTTVSGVRYRWVDAAATESAAARYTPNITQTDYYPVYCWTRDGDDRVRQTYRIHHNGGISEVVVDHRMIGKGWVWLGNYHFLAGTSGYVEITNASPDSGVVVADAIRFGNGIGDVVGVGPNTVSGYPRDEECQRYWAQSEAGLHAVGLPSSIWHISGLDDSGDNVGTGARWAATMNRQSVNNDRWRRVYIEFHTNASGSGSCITPPCSAKGTLALITTTGATTNQASFAALLGNKVGSDMVAQNGQFEYPWSSRSPTYTGAYGAISTGNNDNEFDATLLEVAFHDNTEDTANLLNPAVRAAVARSTMQGIIMFLHGLPGSTVPLIFPPETPTNVRAIHDGAGGVVVSWTPPPSGTPDGSPATGYRIYRSSDGYGFDGGVAVGNVLTYTLADIAPRTTTFIRVSATNAGGESMPSAVLAVRLPAPDAGHTRVMLVYGYNRVDRALDPAQTIPLGPMHRPIISKVNTFDYVIQHAASLVAAGVSFDSSSNGSVENGSVSLSGYPAVVWILGAESMADKTLSAAEQAALTAYLNGGGRLLITGQDLATDLDNMNNGRTFLQQMLRCAYRSGNANTSLAQAVTGGIFADIGSFSFGPTNLGAPYPAISPDSFTPQTGAINIVNYIGRGTSCAGVQYDSGTYKAVTLGFPFESVIQPATRDAMMQRVLDYFGVAEPEPCTTTMIGDFEAYADGTAGVIFRNPRYSSTTSANLAATPDTAQVTTEVAAYDGTKCYKVAWAFADTSVQRWLRLTTDSAPNLPSPTVRLDRPLRLRLRLEAPAGGSVRVSLGLRETDTGAPLGSDGGTTGSVEWVGASTVISGAPQGVHVTAQPGVWQTVVFDPARLPTAALTGDGHLTGLHAKGVLEHLALAVADSAGPFTLYLDGIEEVCSFAGDFNHDDDVDLLDFAHFRNCFNGSDLPPRTGTCGDADLDSDNDVDIDDFTIFRNCYHGPNATPAPACPGRSDL